MIVGGCANAFATFRSFPGLANIDVNASILCGTTFVGEANPGRTHLHQPAVKEISFPVVRRRFDILSLSIYDVHLNDIRHSFPP